jgi:hypothetical protein
VELLLLGFRVFSCGVEEGRRRGAPPRQRGGG